VAAGFTIFTLGLVLLGSQPAHRRVIAGVIAALSLGLVLAMGSRPGIWVGLLAAAIGTLVLTFLATLRTVGREEAVRSAVSGAAAIVAACTIAWVFLWLIYPATFGSPISLLANSLGSSQAFPWSGETLTAGLQFPAQPPPTYVPLWLGGQLPLIVLVLAALGTVVAGVGYIRVLRGSQEPSRITVGSIPVVLQAFAVPSGAILLGSTLYGGLRQLLFVFPAIALLAVIGLYWVLLWTARQKPRRLTPIVWALVIAGLFVTLISQLRLFPYSHAYFNAAASAGDIDRNWDVDGWWLSGRELVENQRFPERTICVDSAERTISSCSRMEMVTPFLSEFGGSDIDLQEDQYVALSRFPYPVNQDPCAPFREVTRGLFLQQIQLSHADVCTASLTQYPSEGLSFAGLVKEDPVLLWGWNPYLLWGWGDPDPDGVWMVGPSASIGFVLPTTSVEPSGELSVTVTGSALANDGASLRVFVNGTDSGTLPIPGEGQTETSTLAVPESAWDGLGEDRVIVRFQAEGIDPESLASAVDTGLPGLIRIDDLVLTNSPPA